MSGLSLVNDYARLQKLFSPRYSNYGTNGTAEMQSNCFGWVFCAERTAAPQETQDR